MNISKQTKLNPSEVMKQWGIGRTKLYELMNDGKLSYEKTEAGKRRIDLSEAIRALGEPVSVKTVEVPGQSVFLVQVLQQQIESQNKMHEQMTKALQDRIDSQEKQLETMTESIDRVTRLLEHQHPINPPAPIEPEKAPETPTVEPVNVEQPPQQAKRKKSFLGRILAAAIDG